MVMEIKDVEILKEGGAEGNLRSLSDFYRES